MMPLSPARMSGKNNLTIPEFSGGIIKFFVSSNHLRLASPVFERMLTGGWAEGSALRTRGIAEIKVQSTKATALFTLLNIIHGRTRKVPRKVSLDLLTQLAVLVDYYECHEAVEVFSKIWIKAWKNRWPDRYGYDVIRWLCISWVFRDGRIFKNMTRILQRQATNPLQTFELPIPSRIVGELGHEYFPFS